MFLLEEVVNLLTEFNEIELIPSLDDVYLFSPAVSQDGSIDSRGGSRHSSMFRLGLGYLDLKVNDPPTGILMSLR